MSDCIKLSSKRITQYPLIISKEICDKNQKKKDVKGSLNEVASALRKLTFILLEIINFF